MAYGRVHARARFRYALVTMVTPPFASTGPAGHRARMRDRLLARGGDGLADYEMLEMLLFIGIARGDTKPLAKGLINHFGSLGGVLAASPRALADVGGLALRAILPLRLVSVAAERLARAEAQRRPVLGSLAVLEAYLRTGDPTGPGRLLLLDNRNRLLADERSPLEDAADDAALRVGCRAALRRALELHATALILADPAGHGPDGARRRAEAARALRDAAALLSIVLHDRVRADPGGLFSYRRAGLLG